MAWSSSPSVTDRILAALPYLLPSDRRSALWNTAHEGLPSPEFSFGPSAALALPFTGI
jgi:hypothetical protein